MGDKARKYTQTTMRRLFILSCNKCAAPDCHNGLMARDGTTAIAKICHIEAASINGARYNSDMTDDGRRNFNNLILLCDECHSIVDNKENEFKYSVKILKEWKRNHENSCRQGKLIDEPQMLNKAINAIAAIDFPKSEIDKDSNKPFNITEKIKYNSIKRNKYLIEDYSKYYGKINSLYSELEKQGSFKKEKLLRNIKLLYQRIKGGFINGKNNELEIIQENADNIFEAIEDKLSNIVDKVQSNNEKIYFALPIILVDAFMRCKILEEPE